MPTIAEIRAKFPQYDDLSDEALTEAVRRKFYSDMTPEEFRGKIESAKGPPPKERGTILDSIVGQGLMLGFGDEAKAAARAGVGWMKGQPFGEAYDRELASTRADLESYRERHPVLSTAGEVGGALGGVVATGGASLIPRAATTAGRLGLAATEGAGYGGLYGFGSGEGGAANRVANSAVGSVIGAPLGVAGQTVGRGVEALRSTFAGPAGKAEKVVGQAMQRDDLTPDSARTRLGEMGPDAMLADLGPNLTQQAGGIASLGGAGQKIVRDALTQRAMGAGGRIEAGARAALGPRRDVPSLASTIIAERAAKAKPLYDAAYARSLPDSPGIVEALSTPAGRLAWSKAQYLAKNEGIPLDFARPTVRALDLTKRALDDMIDAARRRGSNNEARIISGVRDRLLAEVDAAVPEFAAARQVYAGDSAIKDAMELGQGVFSRTLSPDDLKGMLAPMTQGEREAFTIGARAQLDEAMGTARNDALAARALFERGYNAEKLAMLIGDDAAKKFLGTLGIEKTFQNTFQRVTQNSETAARQAAQRELGVGAGDFGVREGYITAGARGMGRAAVIKAGEAGINAFRGRTRERIAEEVAKLATATGAERDAALKRLSAILAFSPGRSSQLPRGLMGMGLPLTPDEMPAPVNPAAAAPFPVPLVAARG